MSATSGRKGDTDGDGGRTGDHVAASGLMQLADALRVGRRSGGDIETETVGGHEKGEKELGLEHHRQQQSEEKIEADGVSAELRLLQQQVHEACRQEDLLDDLIALEEAAADAVGVVTTDSTLDNDLMNGTDATSAARQESDHLAGAGTTWSCCDSVTAPVTRERNPSVRTSGYLQRHACSWPQVPARWKNPYAMRKAVARGERPRSKGSAVTGDAGTNASTDPVASGRRAAHATAVGGTRHPCRYGRV